MKSTIKKIVKKLPGIKQVVVRYNELKDKIQNNNNLLLDLQQRISNLTSTVSTEDKKVFTEWNPENKDNLVIDKIELPEYKSTNYNDIDFTDIEYYDEEKILYIEKYLLGYVEGTEYNKRQMSYKESAYLNGIIRKTKPKNIVEIGISAGGNTCVILNAIRDMADTKLYSFDYNTKWYREAHLENSRKSGFLVNEIIPELMNKWELYTGGVPCKYFDDYLPKEGIDICFVDTVHSNPGEHLNILEIMPYMKKNGIIILHDTNYHTLFNVQGYTNIVLLNTLKGKRIYLKSEKTMCIPNIGAIILDDNINEMLFPLFSNLSLPWFQKILDSDYYIILKHLMKYYSKNLIQIYTFYCCFYMNDGLQNKDVSLKIAEKYLINIYDKFKIFLKKKNNLKPIIAMIHSNDEDAPSETFVRAQRDMIDGKVNYYNRGIPPTYMNAKKIKIPYYSAVSESLKEILIPRFNENESLVAATLIDENTDIVFAQFGISGAGILNVCKKLLLPLIVHFHGIEISAHYYMENYRDKYIEMFKYASYIIAVSRYMENTLIEMGCPKKKIIYNPCAPNDDYYKIQPQFNKKIFIAAGRFIEKKAPQNTIMAFIKVLKKHPDAKLIIAGNGELFDLCSELIKHEKIDESVLIPGTYNPEQLKKWFNEAIAFVQHSITAPNGDMEGTPVVICEASLAGLPVISTFHAGIPDVIIDGKTGLLVEEGDIDGMAENMIWILDNLEKAKEMGMAGKQNIWNNFNMKKHISILDKIIKNAINENKKIKNDFKIIYALTPPPHLKNIGDHAQVVAINKWLNKNYPNIQIHEFDKDECIQRIDYIRAITNPQDIVFIHSGGNLGDRGIWSETGRRNIISSLPENKIISLPQTIFFSDTVKGKIEKEKTIEIYNKHKNLTVIGRDIKSTEDASFMFPKANTFSIPDFVLSLNRDDYINIKKPIKKVLFILRDDSEQIFSEKEKNKLLELLDLSENNIGYFDTTIEHEIQSHEREMYIKKTLEYFSDFEMIITDRFHALIFATLLNKPVIVLPTIDHKLTSAINWFNDMPQIKLLNINEIQTIKSVYEELLRVTPIEKDWNKLYFNDLINMI